MDSDVSTKALLIYEITEKIYDLGSGGLFLLDIAMIGLLAIAFALFYGFTIWCHRVESGGEK